MPSKKNPCVYTGRVGAKLRPRAPRPSKRICRKAVRCLDGPFMGKSIRLDSSSDLCTLSITVRGKSGHYSKGCWMPIKAHERVEVAA